MTNIFGVGEAVSFSDAIGDVAGDVSGNMLVAVGAIGVILAIGVGVRFLVKWIRSAGR